MKLPAPLLEGWLPVLTGSIVSPEENWVGKRVPALLWSSRGIFWT
jgi:hypothetical protein